MSYYNWPTILEKYSDSELNKIILNQRIEPADKVDAALIELKKRGNETDHFSHLVKNFREDIPKLDNSSPRLYSKEVIYTFSILFSIIFGGFLFVTNLNEINKKNGIFPVLTFSFIYTALSIYLLIIFKLGFFGTLSFGVIGALILNNIFWNKYVGKGIAYHKRSYRKPLIIAIIIFLPLTALIIWSMVLTGQI